MQAEQLILAMDTATKCSTVSLTRGTLKDGEILATLSLSSDVTHSRRLISSVDILFEKTQVEWQDISAVAVGLGPGSFTGLRIGMATAKGFASAADIKLLGVSTLDALAATCFSEKKICALMDARKKQVYAAFYMHPPGEDLQRVGDICVCSPEQLIDSIDEPVLMVGDGVQAFAELWQSELADLACFAHTQHHSPQASVIGLLCGEMLQNGDCLDVGSAAPVYVRASDAELSLADKKKKKR